MSTRFDDGPWLIIVIGVPYTVEGAERSVRAIRKDLVHFIMSLPLDAGVERDRLPANLACLCKALRGKLAGSVNGTRLRKNEHVRLQERRRSERGGTQSNWFRVGVKENLHLLEVSGSPALGLLVRSGPGERVSLCYRRSGNATSHQRGSVAVD